MKEVAVKLVNDSVNPDPFYAKHNDSGMDLSVDFSGITEIDEKMRKGEVEYVKKDGVIESVVIPPQTRVILPTKIKIQLPSGTEAQVRPRSGTSFKKGITISNTPGTIDQGYTNYIGIIVSNLTDKPITIEQSERIAQLVICPVYKAVWDKKDSADEFDDTERGEGGFGHTGTK